MNLTTLTTLDFDNSDNSNDADEDFEDSDDSDDPSILLWTTRSKLESCAQCAYGIVYATAALQQWLRGSSVGQ